MVLILHRIQTVLIARVFLWSSLVAVPGGLLLGPEIRWSVVGAAVGFGLAGLLLIQVPEPREDALNFAGTQLVIAGIVAMVGTACVSIMGLSQPTNLVDALHATGLAAGLSGAGMRLFSSFLQSEEAKWCARVWEPFPADAVEGDSAPKPVERTGKLVR